MDISRAWEVLLLFLVPIGGGIPAGVILAQKYDFTWPTMALLYFISDVILACIFEPLLLLFLRLNQNTPRFARIREVLKHAMQSTVNRYGLKPGPFTLVMITFGTDPMTGRAIAKAAGHGFLSGWAFTIAGDMIFFFVLMASTLWLNNILGNGTLTAAIIMLAMFIIPIGIKKYRGR